MKKNGWLAVEHPTYTACKELWAFNERMGLGGPFVFDELQPFDWELPNGAHYLERQRNAVYTNYPDRFASIIVGHLWRQAPVPAPQGTLDYGAMGFVRRVRDVARPTRAELLHYNTDGIGEDGSQWDAYWASVAQMAVFTGHRWTLTEGPDMDAISEQDEIDGVRPYMSDYSPLAVHNWHYERGRLMFAIFKRSVRNPRLDAEDRLFGNESATEYVLLTRRGWTGFGETYAFGGWFRFDGDGELVDFGDYDALDGAIPMSPLFYDRLRPTNVQPRNRWIDVGGGRIEFLPMPVSVELISRSGTTELAHAARLQMNLESAASFEAWDGAQGVKALLNVAQDQFNLFVNMVKAGNRYAPLQGDPDSTHTAGIADASGSGVAAEVFDRLLTRLKNTVVELMLNEVQVAPDASARARRVAWTDVRTPKLVTFASNIETNQNFHLYNIERLWRPSFEPRASVAWRRNFDLIDPQAVALDFFEMEKTAGVSSPTLKTKVMVHVAKANNFLGDDTDETTVEREYEQSARDFAARQAAGMVDGGAQDRSEGGGERGTSEAQNSRTEPRTPATQGT